MSPRRSSAAPPRWAERFLALLLGNDDRDTVLDEVAELYEERSARHGAAAADRWYRRQVVVFALLLARHGRQGGVRAGRSRFQEAMDARDGRRRGGEMASWARETGQAVRRLSRAPVFTTVGVLTIAVGIGAFASIFSLVDGVLLEPMPYENPDELAWVWRDYVEADFPRGWLGGPDVVGMVEQPQVFTDVVAFMSGSANLGGVVGGSPVRVDVQSVSAPLFESLGVPLGIGRDFTPDEMGTNGPNVVILSYDIWRTHFGADPSIVGRTVDLSGVATEVVGVAPAGFRFVKHGSLVDPEPADVYTPLRVDLAAASPGSGSFAALVRIPTDVPTDRLEAALETAAAPVNAFMAQYDASPVHLWSIGLEEDLVAPVRPAILTLVGAATFLLLILAANLATLLLGRAAARGHELGIRIALGAGRPRILRSVLAESTVLAVLGGALGIVLAYLGTALVVRLAPDDLPRLGSVSVDGSVLGVAALVTAAMAFTTGLMPAMSAFRAGITDVLKEGGGRSGTGVRASRTRMLLVTAQVALSLMLLVGAGLTVQAFGRLLAADPGFDPGGTLTFAVPMPGTMYDEPTRVRLEATVRERLAALPGVTRVGTTNALPLTLSTNQNDIRFPGAPGNTGDDQQDSPLIDAFRSSPGYLAAAGYRLLAGRDFEPSDADSTRTLSMIIDDVLADHFFPDGSAIGSRASVSGDTATIVGIVDQAHLYTVHSDDRGQVYLPLARFPTTLPSYAVRASVPPASLVPAVRAALRDIDEALPLADVRSLQEIVDASLGEQRLSLTLILGFAAGALLLAVLGIYGVVSNTVVRRRQEIGVRMALGASGDEVVRMVLVQGVRLAVVGALVGLAGTLATARVVRGLMFGIDTGDLRIYALVALGLVAIAALASWVPARRATRIDPTEALRPQ